MKPKKIGSTRVAATARLEANLKSQLNPRSSLQPVGTCVNSAQTPKGGSSGKSFAYICSGCNKPIKRDRFLLKACEKYWHENCLRCDRCHSRLGELGSSLFCKSNMNLCRQDYLEMFGETGVCSVCEKLICASEMVMRAKMNVYHLECFACQLCNQRFCVGDRFYLCENKVVCQYDYDEHILPIQRSLLQQQQSAELELYPPQPGPPLPPPPQQQSPPQQQQPVPREAPVALRDASPIQECFVSLCGRSSPLPATTTLLLEAAARGEEGCSALIKQRADPRSNDSSLATMGEKDDTDQQPAAEDRGQRVGAEESD